MNRVFQGVFAIVLGLSLFACGGGGGGGSLPAVSLSGSVTDSQPGTIKAVIGATVQVVQADTGKTVATVKTDAAGRYEVRGLAAGVPYQVLVNGPTEQYFPASGEVTIVKGAIIRRDFSLPRTGLAQAVSGGYESLTTMDGGLTAGVTTPTSLLTATGAAYTGSPQVYLAPIDVSRIGNGFAQFQDGFVVVAAVAPASIRLAYASAALDVRSSTGAALTIDPAAPVTLTLPVPVPLQGSAPAASSLTLYHFNESTLVWEAVPTAALTEVAPIADIEAYSAQVAGTGLYQVVEEVASYVSVGGRLVYDDYAAAIPDNPATTTINEAVPEHPATPAAGATVYVNAIGAGYQQVVTTDADGYFVAYVEDPDLVASHDLRFESVAWGNGIELSTFQDLTRVAMQGLSPAVSPLAVDYFIPGDTTAGGIVIGVSGALPYQLDSLPVWALNPVFQPAAKKEAVPVTVLLDAGENIAPSQLGLMGAYGRSFNHPDPTIVELLSDLAINANSLVLNGEVTVDPTSGSLGLQQVAGTFESVHSAPADGYSTTTGIDITPGTTFPVVVMAKSGAGHYVKVSIDNVTGVAGQYDVTLRMAFSLTGRF